MMKAVLLESELYNGAMTDLIEMRDAMELEFIDKGHIWTSAEYVRRTTAQILRSLEKAASIAELVEDGERFEIINAEEGTFMDISEESES